MWKLAIAICFMCESIALADKPPVTLEQAPLVRVECHGKLRHGVVAIGGETTGTTITFDGLTWELKLPDEPSRTFAKEHHKSPVTAAGTLRRVAGHEKSVRWIVDVERICERDASEQMEATMITIEGQMRMDDSVLRKTPGMELEAAGMTWPLDLTADAAFSAKAESLVGKSAVVTGRLVPDAKAEPPTLVIRVSALNTPMVAHPPQ